MTQTAPSQTLNLYLVEDLDAASKTRQLANSDLAALDRNEIHANTKDGTEAQLIRKTKDGLCPKSLLIDFFSVQPLCSLCLCGCFY